MYQVRYTSETWGNSLHSRHASREAALLACGEAVKTALLWGQKKLAASFCVTGGND